MEGPSDDESSSRRTVEISSKSSVKVQKSSVKSEIGGKSSRSESKCCDLNKCQCCIPLKYKVFIIAGVSFIISLLAIIDAFIDEKANINEDTTLQFIVANQIIEMVFSIILAVGAFLPMLILLRVWFVFQILSLLVHALLVTSYGQLMKSKWDTQVFAFLMCSIFFKISSAIVVGLFIREVQNRMDYSEISDEDQQLLVRRPSRKISTTSIDSTTSTESSIPVEKSVKRPRKKHYSRRS